MSGTRKPPGRPIGDTGDLRARNEELERLLASEREHADAISRQSHELVRKAFQASPVAISVTRMSDGRVIEVNEWFERLLGYTRDEVVGKTTIEIGIWADEGARAGFLKDIAVTGSLANRMCLFHTKNGESVETRFSSETIELDGESCLLSVFVDVTESRKAEKTLVESERKYREIFELMPVSIWEYDISGAMPLLKSSGKATSPITACGWTSIPIWSGSFIRMSARWMSTPRPCVFTAHGQRMNCSGGRVINIHRKRFEYSGRRWRHSWAGKTVIRRK